MYDYDFLDRVIHVTLSNLYTLRDKNSNTIYLTNFSFKNKAHLAVLEIARIAHNALELSVKIELGWFKYFIYNLKYHYRKFCGRARDTTNGIDVSKIISDIEEANNTENLFETIYNAYYGKE